MATVPPIHSWLAGDSMDATRMNEIRDSIEWLRNPPMVHVARWLSSQAIPANIWTNVSFDTLVNSYDPYGFFDAGNPTALTIKVPGWYSCEAVMCFQNTAGTSRLSIGLIKDGEGPFFRWDQSSVQNVATNVNIRKENIIFLNVGDVIKLRANSSVGARNLVAASNAESPQLRIRWISI